jgi:hypothetical protein
MTDPLTGQISELDILEANRRHDTQAHSICMDPRVRYPHRTPTNIVGQELSDKQIDRYLETGIYDAIHALIASKRTKVHLKGNFIEVEGRLIYRP